MFHKSSWFALNSKTMKILQRRPVHGQASFGYCILIRVLIVSVIFVFSGSAFSETTFYGAYDAGLQFEKAGNWKDAREHFLQAASLKPAPARRVRTYGLNFLLDYDPYAHLAHCELQLRMYQEALQHLEISRKAGIVPERRLLDLKERLEAELSKKETAQTPPAVIKVPEPAPHPLEEQKAESHYATLKVESTPSGSTVRIDGESRGETPLTITLPSGKHTVEFMLQGYESGRDIVELAKGETRTVRVTLSEPPSFKPQPVPQPPPEKSVETEAPTKDVTSVSPPSISLTRETPPPAGGPEKISSQPLQRQAETRSTDPGRGWSENIQKNSLLLLVTVVLLASLLALRRRGSAPVSQALKSATILEDTPTHDLRLESSSRVPNSVTENPGAPAGNEYRLTHSPKEVMDAVGGYEIVSVLGRGAMGTTFLANRTRDGLPVALKLPHEHLLDNPEFVGRFLREGSLGSTLHHPNIIRVLEANQADNRPFIAMELLHGQTLEKILRSKGHLPLRDALEIARNVALALDYGRLKGIVHRDLKPENIMILDNGGLKILDYGIARIMDLPGLTSSGAYLGTPSYSAPESAGSADVDQQSDLYSLGIILYRCLIGTLPFFSNNPLEILDMHRSRPLPPFPPESNISDSVFHLVQKLTEKHKADRFKNAESFLIELNRIINQLEPQV